ncbi:neprilysin-11-like [Amblyomma americanum]
MASSDEGNTARIILSGALAAIVVTALVLLAVPWAFSGRDVKHNGTNKTVARSVCTTPDCSTHTVVLGMNRTRYVDPCNDFSLFVCSAWIQKLPGISNTLTGQVTMDWIQSLANLRAMTYTGDASGGESVYNRARQFMTLCLVKRPKSDEAGVQAFKDILSRGDLAFLSPQQYRTAPSYARLIENLAVLSGKWLVPLWFRLELLPFGASDNAPLCVLSPEPLVLAYRRLHMITSSSRELYRQYVEAFVHALYDNGSAVTADYLKFLRQDSILVEARVFNALNEAVLAKDWTAVHGRLLDLREFLPRLSGSDWAAALLKAFDGTLQGGRPITISPGDGIHAKSRVHLETMNKVMAQHTALDLLHHTAWWFAQQIGSLTSNALFDAFVTRYGEFGRTVQVVACAFQIAVTYNVLLAAANYAAVSGSEADNITKSLDLIQSLALKKVALVSRLKNNVRDALVSELKRTGGIIWPTMTHTNAAGLQQVYGETVDNSRGFFGHWLSSRKELQNSLRTLHMRSVVGRIYRVDTTALALYNPALRAIQVSTAALDTPFYYRSGTAAMLFGGLGFLFARGMFQGLDVVTQITDSTAGHSPLAKTRLADAASCPDPNVDKGALFPYLPALEVAHAAYLEVSNGKDERLRGMEQYSEEQVFFLTMCHTLCEEDGRGSTWSPACNAVARNFAPFARAFKCGGGSAMHPAKKCSFLNA